MSDFNHVFFFNTFNNGIESRVISQIREELRFKRGCYRSDLEKKIRPEFTFKFLFSFLIITFSRLVKGICWNHNKLVYLLFWY